MQGGAAEQLLPPPVQIPEEAIMESNQGTKVEAARRRRSGYGTIGMTMTTVALFVVAVFVGTRHAGEKGPPTAEPAPAALPSGGAAIVAGEPLPAKHAPRRLAAANRKELEATLPKGAPVDVIANDGDPEAFRLAEEIRSFLLAKGYPATDVTRSVSTPPAKVVGLEPLTGGKWRVIVGSTEE
jgi:hypothetical protein